MSYDLYFLRRQDSDPVSASDIVENLRSRQHYTVQGTQCWYQNEDTGVYFSFDRHPSDAESADAEGEEGEAAGEVADGLEPVDLSFNINYFRPHYFGLEAELELSALTDRFSLLVDDPQNEGMGRGEYSREGFLRGWNAGNLFGHYACVKGMHEGQKSISNPDLDALPAAKLEAIWSWNYQRAQLQKELGDDVFVPTIRLVRHEGRPQTFVVWGDGIPEALPEVDLYVLVRDELAPRRLFRKSQDVCLVEAEEVRPLLSGARLVEAKPPYHLFRYGQPPRLVVDFFQSRRPLAGKLDGIANDKVLTQETLDRALASTREKRGNE